MVLGDVEETVTTIEIDEETYEEVYRVSIFNHVINAYVDIILFLIRCLSKPFFKAAVPCPF